MANQLYQNRFHDPWLRPIRRGTVLLSSALLLLACSSEKHEDGRDGPDGPLEAVEPIASASDGAPFSATLAGALIAEDEAAFIARQRGTSSDDAPAHFALFRTAQGGAVSVLYAGDELRTPFDLDVGASSDGAPTLYVADLTAGDAGTGAILAFPTSGGEPTSIGNGWFPRGITVSPEGRIYFSGRDPDTGRAGVFTVDGTTVTTVYAGPPLNEPSGIAVFRNGKVVVVDTQLFGVNARDETSPVHTDAGLVAIEDGHASIITEIPHTGYPAGLGLTAHESLLVVSGLTENRSNAVYLVNAADPAAAPARISAPGGNYESSGGLHRTRTGNTFVWADTSETSGAVYRLHFAAHL